MIRKVMTTARAKAALQQDFVRQTLQHATLGGMLALAATALAILFANSMLASAYHGIWQTEGRIIAGTIEINRPLLAWVNDGLLTLLFFAAGLALKRQWIADEQAGKQSLRLSLAAAFGGVVVPAGCYALFNVNRSSLSGWMIPIATDASIALALITLPRAQIPFSLRSFLLTIALIDDVITVVAVTLGQVGVLHTGALGVALLLLAILLLANEWGIRRSSVYLSGAILAWLIVFAVQMPTSLIGVTFAWTIPARHNTQVQRLLHDIWDRVMRQPAGAHALATPMIAPLQAATRAAQPLLHRIEYALHPWVWLVVVPCFAFANTGIPLLEEDGIPGATQVALGISVAFIIGKPLGVVGACWLAARLRIAVLPAGVRWAHLWGIGFLSGCGFTVALLAANTTLSEPGLLAVATLNILRASLVAAGIGLIILTCASVGDKQRVSEVHQGSDIYTHEP